MPVNKAYLLGFVDSLHTTRWSSCIIGAALYTSGIESLPFANRYSCSEGDTNTLNQQIRISR